MTNLSFERQAILADTAPSFAPSVRGELGTTLKRLRIRRSQVAGYLGVSLQTVNNWCSGRVRIPVHRLAEVGQVIEQNGGVPLDVAGVISAELEAHGLTGIGLNPSRSSGRRPKTMMIIGWDLLRGAPPFPHLARLVRAALEGLGFQCLLIDCEGSHGLKRFYVSHARALGFEGLVLVNVQGEGPDRQDELLSVLEPVTKEGIPVVLVHPWTGSISLPERTGAIGWDPRAVDSAAIGVLADQGHTKIGFLLPAQASLTGGAHRGIPEAMRTHGLPFKEEFAVAPAESAPVGTEVEQLIRQVTALFVAPFQLRFLPRLVYATNLRWPDNISLVTTGHERTIPILGTRPLTYVELPIDRIAVGAARLLARMLNESDRNDEQNFVLFGPSTLDIRHREDGSVGPARKARRTARSPGSTSPVVPGLGQDANTVGN